MIDSAHQDQPARDLCAEVLRLAFKDMRRSTASRADHAKSCASALVFLASRRATPFFAFLGLDQTRVLQRIDFVTSARRALAHRAGEEMTDEERTCVRGAVDHLESTADRADRVRRHM